MCNCSGSTDNKGPEIGEFLKVFNNYLKDDESFFNCLDEQIKV